MKDADEPSVAPGTLCVVATPIGNLEDITLRAVGVLREVQLILAEDTRRTRVLCQAHGIDTPLRAFHAHNADAEIPHLVERLRGGARLALVTDAGTPLVSDPGARLVGAALDAGAHVTTAPGPSAVLSALCVAGLRAERFRFVGFLPRTASKRRAMLDALRDDLDAWVLFESPKRLPSLLSDLAQVIGDRRVAVCRELTKLHEEVVRGKPSELAEHFKDGARGEITLVVEAREGEPQLDLEEVDEWIGEQLARGEHPKEIARRVATRSALSGSEAYERVLRLRRPVS